MNTTDDIWVIDDDEAIRFVLQRALSRRGYGVTCFETVGDVRRALRSAQPRPLFTDIRLSVALLTGAMGMFGDVLSYMRLFALGLASASLALTFNDLATQIRDAIPGLGLLLALLLLLLGHAINLGLAIMSGVVHGLRLNFIEFYKWGVPGEGKAFQKFARKEVKP